MTKQAQAAVLRSFGEPLSIETITVAAPGPNQVRIQIKACAVCHSDIIFFDGGWGGELPAVYGHEAAGIVESVGPGVEGLDLGDHVVVSLIRSCGTCHSCSRGQPVNCSGTFAIDDDAPLHDESGEVVQHGLGTGTFAEYAVVDASQTVVVPSDIPFASASLLGCGVITGVGAVFNTAAIEPGSHVAVIGCGGVGINTIQGAALAGAGSVVAIDVADGKLSAALSFGATSGVSALAADAVAQVRELTDGRGADYVFVTVGAKVAIEQSFGFLAPGGAVVLVGMTANGVTVDFDSTALASMNQRVLGSKMGSGRLPVDIPKLVALYQQGQLQLDELVTGRFRLDQIDEAVASVKRGEALRNVIEFA
ncbi:MAG: Zn-dependent alcohol dehydrogenase [Acidimicrobiales bacterium]